MKGEPTGGDSMRDARYRDERITDEYLELFDRAKQGVDCISSEDRERFSELGYYYLDVEGNAYEAMRTFCILHDFVGLRKVADKLIAERGDSYDLPEVLLLLEDYEGIWNFLNNREFNRYACESLFEPLGAPLDAYIEEFLLENKTPVATGAINRGVDLIAIRNLAMEYDVAVPIARGGLNQGAIAHLWGMPTKIVDISAHNRKVAKGKWVNPVSDEDFKGKKVLFFDKDAVTGASVRKAMAMLSRFDPANVGIYFTHNAVPEGVPYGTKLGGLPENINVLYPNVAPLENAGSTFFEAHERLGTLYGRRRLMEQKFIEEADRLNEQSPDLSRALREFTYRCMDIYDSFNQFLPGVSEIRERILSVMNTLFERHKECEDHGLYDVLGVKDNLINLLNISNPILDYESILVRARYDERAAKLAGDRGVENLHKLEKPLAAFNTAFEAVKDGFDVALIVGPEGFTYEPFFKDFGIPTVAVNIPESGAGEGRTIQLLDSLSGLKDKRVLVVEDDVQTGATLQKLLESFGEDAPREIALYLGLPKQYQMVGNIPADFGKVYMADDSDESPEVFTEHMKSKGLRFFKNIAS